MSVLGNDSNEVATPLPGVVTSFREDVLEPIDWKVVPSVGDFGVGVDFVKGILSIPLDLDDDSKFTRLQQLVKARVSPLDDAIYAAVEASYDATGVTADAIRVAEIARINVITNKFAEAKGWKHEPDGSEKTIGKRLATANTPQSWDKAVEFTIRNLGTKSFDSFASGVRSVNPDWSKTLRNLNKRMLSNFSDDVMSLGDTTPISYGHVKGPQGFSHSVYAAIDFYEYLSDGYRAPQDIKAVKEKAQEERAQRYGEPEKNEVNYTKNTLNREQMSLDISNLPDDYEFDTDNSDFHKLVIDDNLPLTVEVKGYMRRRRKAMQYGRRVTYPSRLLTDPERRVFGHKVKVKGGIIVCDISGSMSLSQADIEAIVESAPAAVIIAYSEDGYSMGENSDGVPHNAWILANRGWRVKDIPQIGHGNNGVDGPALTWAIRHRKYGEDIVWISDGHCNGQGGSGLDLVKQCAMLVKKHKIIMIPSAEEAVAMFKKGKIVNKPAGPIREALLGNR